MVSPVVYVCNGGDLYYWHSWSSECLLVPPSGHDLNDGLHGPQWVPQWVTHTSTRTLVPRSSAGLISAHSRWSRQRSAPWRVRDHSRRTSRRTERGTLLWCTELSEKEEVKCFTQQHFHCSSCLTAMPLLKPCHNPKAQKRLFTKDFYTQLFLTHV